MEPVDKHLARLRELEKNPNQESGDEVIWKMLPEIGALMATLNGELAAAHKTLIRLTWVIIWLTVAIAVFAGVAAYPIVHDWFHK